MKRNYGYGLICILAFMLVTAACSFNTPSVTLVKRQRLYTETQQGKLTEQLAAFILLEDRDGRNDYKELTLREDATALEWGIHRENTVFLQEAGYAKNVQWAGSNKFRYPRHFFPAGQYTVTAVDLGGNKTEASFSLAESLRSSALPFRFTVEGEQWSLQIHDTTACSAVSLIFLSADRQPLTVYPIQINDTGIQNGSLVVQERPSDARYVQCFAENTDQSIGFLSLPQALPQ